MGQKNGLGLRDVFEMAAIGVGAVATVTAVVTGAGLPASMIAVGLSAAYLLKR